MDEPTNHQPSPSLLLPAVAFEGALAVLAVFLGWLIGRSPLESLHWSPPDAGLAIAATLVPLAILIPCISLSLGAAGRAAADRRGNAGPPLHRLRPAGPGDHLRAGRAGRGDALPPDRSAVVRPTARRALVGLLGAALLFAGAHWITTTYAVIAGLIGSTWAGCGWSPGTCWCRSSPTPSTTSWSWSTWSESAPHRATPAPPG